MKVNARDLSICVEVLRAFVNGDNSEVPTNDVNETREKLEQILESIDVKVKEKGKKKDQE